jgi:hypothetical protein
LPRPHWKRPIHKAAPYCMTFRTGGLGESRNPVCRNIQKALGFEEIYGFGVDRLPCNEMEEKQKAA